MGVAERKDREKEALRRKIMDAARTLFVEQGYESVSMRKIADAIEYSPTAIYLHFADKAALLRDICREDFAALAAAEAKAARVEDPIERIRQIGLAYMRFGVRHPQQYRLMFMTPLDQDELKPTEEDLAHKGDPAHDGYAVLQAAVREAQAAGRFRPELTDRELLCQTLWAGVHGATALQVTMKDDPWFSFRAFEKRALLMVDTLLRGLCK
jgi:AcrR family transcriptional regulator